MSDSIRGCVLITARCPDPKLAKAALAPFHAAQDGTTTTSASGFVVSCGGRPVVVTSAAVVYPLLQQRRRQQQLAGGGGLAGASHADLSAGARLSALVAPAGSSSRSAGSPHEVELWLAGLAEMPGVRAALAQLLAAPSIAGSGGWQLGWLLQRQQQQQQVQPTPQLGRPPWLEGEAGRRRGSSSVVPPRSITAHPAGAAGSAPAGGMLEVACHLAVLLPTTAAGAAALTSMALPWPGSSSSPGGSDSRSGGSSSSGGSSGSGGSARPMREGQLVSAVGSPFGALSPLHFTVFTSCGVVAAVVPGEQDLTQGRSGRAPASANDAVRQPPRQCQGRGQGQVQPALLLSDLKCGPGMEGGPIFAAGSPPGPAPAPGPGPAPMAAPAAAPAAPAAGRLVGMLLPPLKAPAAQIEFALAAPAPAVAAAVQAALAACSPPVLRCSAARPAAAAAPAAAAPAAAAPAAVTGAPIAAAAAAAAAQRAAAQRVRASAAAVAGGPDRVDRLGMALQSVVAVSTGSGWATGVIVSSAGHILTNAHLLEPAVPSLLAGPRRGRGSGSTDGGLRIGAEASLQGLDLLPHPPLQVLLPAGIGSGGSSGSSLRRGRWSTADVLYVFSGPLDLAVLQLRSQQGEPGSTPAQPQPVPAWRPLALSCQPPQPGQRICVAGFPAFNPRSSPLGAVVTAGCIAKVVRSARGGSAGDQPAMLLTTAAVHSGASGGAVLDASTGELVGLVTSNAKHSSTSSSISSGGGSKGSRRSQAAVQTVLPHINFCIPAAQLRPVVAVAAAAPAAGAAGTGAGDRAGSHWLAAPPVVVTAAAAAAAAQEAWRDVDAAAAASPGLQQVWQLDRQRRGRLGPRQADEEQQPAGGAFGGAAPPAKLKQLLGKLQQQEAEDGPKQAQQQQQQQRAKL